MDMGKQTHGWSHLFGRVENLEGPATRDFLDGDYRQPRAGNGGLADPARHAVRAIAPAARLEAFDILNAETTVPERRLFALVDSTACLLIHGGSEETARLALESVVGSSVALAAVHVLVGDR